MSSALPSSGCCDPCTTEVTQGVPGPQGEAGSDGAAGTNGQPAYTTLTAGFTMPAVGSDVAIAVVSSAWITIGQVLYIQTAGYFSVQSKADSTHATVRNLGYSGNAAPAALISSANQVGPGGLVGATGATGVSTLNGVSPTQAKGDLIVDNGASAPSASNVRLAVGANNTVPIADSTQAAGMRWGQVPLASAVTGTLPVANGGTGAATAAAALASLGALPLAGGTMTGNLTINKVGAELFIRDTSSTLDNKAWSFSANLDGLSAYIYDDATVGLSAWLRVERTGTTVDSVTFPSGTVIIGGGTSPALELENDAPVYHRRNTVILANGANNDVAIGNGLFFKVSGPSGAFSVTGIAGGADGRRLTILNRTGQNMTIANENVSSIASNRIVTLTGADIASTTDSLVELVYDSDAQRWTVTSSQV